MEIDRGPHSYIKVSGIESDMSHKAQMSLATDRGGDVTLTLTDLESGRELRMYFFRPLDGGNPHINPKLREIIELLASEGTQ